MSSERTKLFYVARVQWVLLIKSVEIWHIGVELL